MKKKTISIVIILIVLVLIFLIPICYNNIYLNQIGTKEALKGKECAPTDIIIEARNYLIDKYGIKAKAISSMRNYKIEGYDFLIPHKEYNNTYSIEMKYQEKVFNVFVDKNSNVIKDDYQHNDITEKIHEYISAFLPECDYKTISYGYGLLSEYVDTLKMEEFLNEKYTTISVFLIDTDITDEKFDKIKEMAKSNTKITLKLISCRSHKDRDILIEYGPSSYDSEFALQIQSMYYNSYTGKDKTHREGYVEYDIDKYGELYYTVPKNGEIEITDNDRKSGYYYEEYDLITPAFNINCDDNVTVFYPVSYAHLLNSDREYYGEYYNIGGETAYIIGDYYAYTFHSEQWYKDNHYYNYPHDEGYIFGIFRRYR